MITDYATPALRLVHTEARRNCQTLDEARAYMNHRALHLPPAAPIDSDTDIRETIVEAKSR